MPRPSLLRPPTLQGSSVTSQDTRYFVKAKTIETSRSAKSRGPRRLTTCSKEGGRYFMEIFSVSIQYFDGNASQRSFTWHLWKHFASRDSPISSGVPLLP